MTVTMPLNSASTDASVAPHFAEAKYFAFATDETKPVVESIEEEGGRDIARSLIAHDVDVVITSELDMNPFVLLKSYGLKIFATPNEKMTMEDALAKLHNNELTEVTAENYVSLFGDKQHIHACA